MGVRTDLAHEMHEICRRRAGNVSEIDGVSSCVEKIGDISITRVNILDENGEKVLGKAKGRYAAIEAPELKYDNNTYERVCRLICDELIAMADIEQEDITLVAGLGNDKITADALGQRVIDKLMVTNHLREYMTEEDTLGRVCAIKPGVLGTTGIETARIVCGVSSILHPKLIIAVDALAAADISRVCTTIQLSDTGILPGSGVGNDREGINEETTGTKVIAIGVPTVIDAANISKYEIPEELSPLAVTTKDIDLVIERMALTVANGINLALHRNITLSEIAGYVG